MSGCLRRGPGGGGVKSQNSKLCSSTIRAQRKMLMGKIDRT